MEERPMGEVTQLMRYPVKSMAGERLTEASVAEYGLYGDRGYAFIDETKEGWNRYVTARQIPQMLGYRAALAEAGEPDGVMAAIPPVQVTGPDGRIYDWNESLLNEIQQLYKRTRLSLLACEPGSELLAVDSAPILLVTEQSVGRLSAILGKDVEWLRFRPNIVITLPDGQIQHERELVGAKLRIGEAVLRVTEPCERCMMITIDPDTLEKDKEMLKKVHQELNLQFGLYASVVRPGKVKLGDRVSVTG